MLSVTQRIKTITQPDKGYVPKVLFEKKQFKDNSKIMPVESAFASIQGMAVDYLTRFILSKNKSESFSIAIFGAMKIDEAMGNNNEIKHIKELLKNVNGLDEESIRSVCQISGYDIAVRVGVKAHKSVDEIIPTKEVINNIRIMVNRSIEFLNKMGPVVKFGFTFEEGYTRLVSSGDGDYLTPKTLIDFKVSKEEFSTKWSLQLLMYYLMGIHSIHLEFQTINSLCIYNPLKNVSYTIDVDKISDACKYIVSNKVIGYKMKHSYYVPYKERKGTNKPEFDYSTWREVDGSDPLAVRIFLSKNISYTFDSSKYIDGIHEITIDDYWAYLKTTDCDYKSVLRPLFDRTESVIMIKKNGYLMFLSKAKSGKLSVFEGGHIKRATHTVEYYYSNLDNYGKAISTKFEKYWDALRYISNQMQLLTPNEKYLRKNHYSDYLEKCKSRGFPELKFQEWYNKIGKYIKLEGKIHGCIVDLDFINHIYLNPYNGKITAYSARSMYDKDVYPNVKSLIASKRPEMLESLLKQEKNNETYLQVMESEKMTGIVINKGDNISKKFLKEYSTDMYEISRKFKQLQKIKDYKLVTGWYDEILSDNIILIEDKSNIQITTLRKIPQLQSGNNEYSYKINDTKRKTQKFVGEERLQIGGRKAKLIEYRNYADVDIQFDDGVIIEHIPFEQWKKGKVSYRDKVESNGIVGKTKKMNCGMNATIIKYFNGDNITVKFEDGTIKEHVRIDHFWQGKIKKDC